MPLEKNGLETAKTSYTSPELARFVSPAFLSILEDEIKEKTTSGHDIKPFLERVFFQVFSAGKSSR